MQLGLSADRMFPPVPRRAPPHAPVPRRTACVTAALMMVAGCAVHRDETALAELYGRWFVSPTAARRDSLIAMVSAVHEIQQAAERAVRHGREKPGNGAAELRCPADRPYVMGYATPAGFRAERTYPLVVYLHGGIAGATEDKGRRAYEMLLPLVDSCEAFLASPSATGSTPWWSPEGVERILQAVRYMTLHFPIDRTRVVLIGVSDGGLGCWAAATLVPGPFAGFVAISTNGALLSSLGIPLTAGNLMQRPIYSVNGGRDRLYPIEQVETFLQTLRGQGVEVDRKVYPDEDHGFDYRDREMGALAQRIRAWRLPANRRGISWRLLPGYPCRADNLVSLELSSGLAGLPALNAYWDQRRLVVRSSGIRSFIFRTQPLEKPPVVVANGRPAARATDVSARIMRVLEAVQQICFPELLPDALYAVEISGGG